MVESPMISQQIIQSCYGNLNFCNILIHMLLLLNVGRDIFSWYGVILNVRPAFVEKMRLPLIFSSILSR